MTTDEESLRCKFCGEELIGPNPEGQLFIALDHQVVLWSDHNPNDRCNAGECLNRAGHITKHHPDAPEWNGGIDYSDGRARYQAPVRTAM
jgi:hypothetical protein